MVLRAQRIRLRGGRGDLAVGGGGDAVLELVGRAPGLDGDVVVDVVAGAQGRRAGTVELRLGAVEGGVAGGLLVGVAADDGEAFAGSARVLGEGGRRGGEAAGQGEAEGSGQMGVSDGIHAMSPLCKLVSPGE